MANFTTGQPSASTNIFIISPTMIISYKILGITRILIFMMVSKYFIIRMRGFINSILV